MLGVLDGAVLVLSAVEGVQPQTRILMRALQRLAVPTLLFINKIDRTGADVDATLAAVRRRLTPHVLSMGRVSGAGSRAATFTAYGADDRTFREQEAAALAEHDDALLATYVETGTGSSTRLRTELAAQTRAGLLHPAYAGSAATGAGVADLVAGIGALLPTTEPDGVGRAVGSGVQDRTRRRRREDHLRSDVLRDPWGYGPASTCRRGAPARSAGCGCSTTAAGCGPTAWPPGRSAG